jgi:hypothetical protein
MSRHWQPDFLIGGFIGSRIIRRVPVDTFRVVIALCGLALAVKLGLSAYRRPARSGRIMKIGPQVWCHSRWLG